MPDAATLDAPNATDAPAASAETPTVTVARGDGIGPEIMDATLRVLDAAGARMDVEEVAIGEQAFKAGHTSGIPPHAWDTIRRNHVMLKAPITTPQGGGYKSLNVTLRKSLGLYANVRPTKSYAPYVTSPHPGVDLVIVRENEEDLYAGIEHRQTAEVVQALKLITRPGTERIVRYAFEYAQAYGRERVTCMTKDNIMKEADGLFHQVFDEVSEEYPAIEADHRIIDIGTAQLAAQPERFDVIVTLNLYGDVLSDVAAQIVGSVGLAGSANVGEGMAMFEAVHGSAPDIAGTGVANPSGLLNGAVQMLVHLGQSGVAASIKNAWLRTLEDGVHTADIHRQGLSGDQVGTRAFTDAVVERLGQRPRHLQPVEYADRSGGIRVVVPERARPDKALVGVDVFIDWDEHGRDFDAIGRRLEAAAEGSALRLKMITNRGVKVYPDGLPETLASDHWRCRFVARADDPSGAGRLAFPAVLDLLGRIDRAPFDVIKTEHLYTFDGARGYSLGQGE